MHQQAKHLAENLGTHLFNLLSQDEPLDALIKEILVATCKRLDMEVAFVSEFIGGRRLMRFVEASNAVGAIRVGCSDPLNDTYCQRVFQGRLPELIHDAKEWPEALELCATSDIPIGAHVSVPIKLSDGKVYGTFCCFSRLPNTSLTEKDLAFVRVFADIIAALLENNWNAVTDTQAAHRDIESILDQDQLEVVFQPIVSLSDGRVLGYEALSRVRRGDWPPGILFEEAARIGLERPLNRRSISRALKALDHLDGDVFLSLNLSPSYALHTDLHDMFRGMPLDRIVLEITEHSIVADYGALAKALAPLRAGGMRLAVDDAGAGYASFRHILALHPDIIKLDMSLTQHIDDDEQRQVLALALAEFSRRRGYLLLAEGVETHAERETLLSLGINVGQGFLYARPQPIKQFRGKRIILPAA